MWKINFMEALVIEGKKKSDFDVFITMAKKLGLKTRLVKEDEIISLSADTLQALDDIEKGKGFKAKNIKDLMDQLNK